MASSSSLRFTSVTPHFFKVILARILTQGKLNVPKKFVSRHGEGLQREEVCLKVGNGAEWTVGVKKSNGEVWFEKGWKEFVEFYCIGVGYFLTFRYETNACFHVTIFDATASEIEYPILQHFSDSQQFEDQIFVYKRRREPKFTPTNLYSVADKKIKITSADDQLLRNQDFHSSKLKVTRKEEEVVCKANTSKSKHNQDLPNVKIESRDDHLKGHEVIKCEHGWRKELIDEATSVTEKASRFQSMTPNPSFIVTIWPSYIHTRKGDPRIPSSFAKIHVEKSQEISLEVSDGRAWKIWCGVRPSQGVNRTNVEMRDGWKAFARDNSLEEGHICVFELIESTNLSFKVTIFR